MPYLAQKTADSSDSSELLGLDRNTEDGDLFHIEVAKLLIERKLVRLTGLAQALQARTSWGHDLAHILIAQGHVRRMDYYREIGRASCRERV